MTLTADRLYELLYRSPSNERSNGVALVRSGKYVTAHSALDLEKLASQINEHFRPTSMLRSLPSGAPQ